MMTESDLVVFAVKKYYPEDYESIGRESRVEGLKQGRREGKAEGLAQGIILMLEARDVDLPADIRERILRCHSLRQLTQWLKRAATASTAGEVVAA